MSSPRAGAHGTGRRALAIASIETYVGSISNRVLYFGLAVLTARLLGSESYGEFAIVQTTVVLLAVALGQPLGVVINRYSAALWESDPDRSVSLTNSLISITLLVGVGLSFGLFLASPGLSTHLFKRPGLAPFLAISGIALLCQVFFLVMNGTLRGFHEFRAAAVAQVLQAVIGVPLAVLLVWQWRLWGAVLGLVAFWGIGSLVSTYGLSTLARQRGLGFGLKLQTEELRKVAPFYLPSLITTLSVAFSTWVVRTILARGEDAYRQVGLFSAAFQYAQVALLIITPLLMVATPILTTAWSRAEHAGFRRLCADLLKIAYLLLAPLAVVTAGWAPWLLRLLGADFALALRATELLLPALAVNAMLALVGPVLIAMEKPWHLAWLALTRAGVLVGLTVLLRGDGAAGAALAYLLTEVVLACALLVLFLRLRQHETVGLVRRMVWYSLPGLGLGALSLLMGATARGVTSLVAGVVLVLGALLALDQADRASLVVLGRQLWSVVAARSAGTSAGNAPD